MQPGSAKGTSFLSHVNGMRALAILGILIYHLNAGYCPTGYYGVDVFLVISGYFLLASLMKAERPGDIHYGSFLLKKSWRILPSWLVVTCVFCFGSALFMIPSDRVEICTTAFRSSYFVADFFIDNLYDYFNQKAHQNLFLHYWYLSITCQMYIIIPLLVMLLLKFFSKRTTVAVLGVIGILSLALYALTTTPHVPENLRKALLAGTGMSTAYYHLLPRLWEIFAGGAVVLLPAWAEHRRLRACLETLGAVGMVASFFCYETGSPYVYVAVLSSLLFLRYGGEGPVSRLLSWRPFQWVGTISFSLYLWHWPIMAGWKYTCLEGVTGRDELVMLLLSLLLAVLAWALVERLRMPKPDSRLKKILAWLPLALLVCFAVGIGPYYRSVRKSPGKMLKGQGTVQEIGDAVNAQPSDETLLRGFSQEAFDAHPVYIGTDASSAPSFILVGDSHSLHTAYGMHHYCSENGGRGIMFNNSVVPFWWCIKQVFGPWNEQRAKALMEYVSQQPTLEYVFIVQLWETRLHARTLTDNNGFPTIDWRTPDKSLDIDRQIALREAGLRETCRRFKEMGLKVVLLADVPFLPHKISPLEQWLKMEMLSDEPPREFVEPVATHKADARYHECLNRMVQEGVAWAVIDSAEALRSGENYRTCNDAGEFLYSDNNHLTFAGSKQVGRYIMQEWERLRNKEEEAAKPAPEPIP